jgi:hypothetical protein
MCSDGFTELEPTLYEAPYPQSQTQQHVVPSHHVTPTMTPTVDVTDPPDRFFDKLPLLQGLGLHVHRQ